MGKIRNYSKTSDIMEINISFGNEQYTFNLNEELVISEAAINKEIKEQPNSYSFLNMLHKKLIRVETEAEAEMNRKYSKIYNRYKEKINENTGRVYDKEYAHNIAIANPGYQKKLQDYIKAKSDRQDIEVCVRGFEQRSYLLQTLSANVRKES